MARDPQAERKRPDQPADRSGGFKKLADTEDELLRDQKRKAQREAHKAAEGQQYVAEARDALPRTSTHSGLSTKRGHRR
jgi:ElaB/YqjD/DUF883 family membrane-anchored ribosome-binding protein